MNDLKDLEKGLAILAQLVKRMAGDNAVRFHFDMSCDEVSYSFDVKDTASLTDRSVFMKNLRGQWIGE